MGEGTSNVRRGGWVCGLVAVVLGTTTVVGGAHRASASDTLTPAQIHQIIRPAPDTVVLPPVELTRRIRASASPSAVGNLTYHNGPVMAAANNSVPIFWVPPKLQDGAAAAPDPNYIPLLERYFDDIGYSFLNQLSTQYYQVVNGQQTFILNNSYRITAIVDTSAYPPAGPGCAGNGVDCVDDAQIRAKVLSVSNAHQLPQDLSTEYFVFLAPHESTCRSTTVCFKSDRASGANFALCAYHGFFTNGSSKTVIYANMPYGAYPQSSVGGCTQLTSFPNNRDADIEISITSHEQIESTTDPVGNGWYYQNRAGEIGDECAYVYGTLGMDGGKANEQWNGHFYAVQEEWSNAITHCAQGSRVPPSAIVAQLGSASAYEGDVGSHTIEFPVTLNMPALSLVRVNYNVLRGPFDTANVGSDFLASSGTLQFAPSYSGHTATIAQIPVTLLSDTTTEPNETFTVQLTSAIGANLGSKVSRGVITNDDPESGLQLTVSNVAIVEGNSIASGAPSNSVQFHVHLSSPVPAAQTVTVKYTVLGVTANGGQFPLPGVDFHYTPSPVTITFNPGQSDQLVLVAVYADKTVEPNETFRLTLSSATGAIIKNAVGTGTIINDD